MDFNKLSDFIFTEIKLKLECHKGLSFFAKERAKFEGWLKVEIIDSLSKLSDNIIPEYNRIDVCFENWSIELKTINTNIRYEGVKNKTRPITKNTLGVIKDIHDLRSKKLNKKAVLFIVFPIEHNNPNWQIQFERIKKELEEITFSSFNFNNGINGMIYFGLV